MMSLVDACVCVCVSRPLGEFSLRTFSNYTDTKAGHICSEMAAQMNRVFSCPERERTCPLPFCTSLNGALSVAIGKHSLMRQMMFLFKKVLFDVLFLWKNVYDSFFGTDDK